MLRIKSKKNNSTLFSVYLIFCLLSILSSNGFLHSSSYRWKVTMMDYFDAMNTLAEQVFVLLAVSIGVDPAIFKGHFSESMNDLRLMHYLPKVLSRGHS